LCNEADRPLSAVAAEGLWEVRARHHPARSANSSLSRRRGHAPDLLMRLIATLESELRQFEDEPF
jgi:hypothetical protein